MYDLSVILKNLIPNTIIFLTTLYVASKNSPIAFICGALITILFFIAISYFIGKRSTKITESDQWKKKKNLTAGS